MLEPIGHPLYSSCSLLNQSTFGPVISARFDSNLRGHTFCILVKTFFPGTFPYSLNAFWSSSLIDYKSALLAAYTGSRSSPRYQPCSTGSAKTSRGEIVNTYQLVRVHFWRCTFALVQMLSPALCYASNRLRFRLPSVLSLPQ